MIRYFVGAYIFVSSIMVVALGLIFHEETCGYIFRAIVIVEITIAMALFGGYMMQSSGYVPV